MSIINYLFDPRRPGGPLASRSYATGLLLMTTFAASVGGLATPVGAAPNMIGLGFIRDVLDVNFRSSPGARSAFRPRCCCFCMWRVYLGLLVPRGPTRNRRRTRDVPGRAAKARTVDAGAAIDDRRLRCDRRLCGSRRPFLALVAGENRTSIRNCSTIRCRSRSRR